MSSEFDKNAKSFDRATLLRRGAVAGGSLALAGALPQLASARNVRNEGTTLNLVAYSTPKPVMGQLISNWTGTSQGQGVSFTQSYGPSTSQMQAVAAGQPADIVFPSWPGDIQILVDAGLVDPHWDEQSYRGIEANTVVVFALRDGNPKKIKGWNDLVKPGVQVITPSPWSSGSAKWNVLAAYSAQRHLGKSDKQAIAYVQQLFKNVVAQPTSGSNATAAFLSGQGDVLITYESEAIAARLSGTNIQYVIPRQTLLIQLPIAVVKKSSNKDLANQFIQYTKETAGQVVFGQHGFRPVNPTAAKQFKSFPVRPGQITLADKTLGGYAAAQKRWFATGGLMYKIEAADGGPSS
jgi:sulfate/thiosulfate transport system substrate-binding protein